MFTDNLGSTVRLVPYTKNCGIPYNNTSNRAGIVLFYFYQNDYASSFAEYLRIAIGNRLLAE